MSLHYIDPGQTEGRREIETLENEAGRWFALPTRGPAIRAPWPIRQGHKSEAMALLVARNGIARERKTTRGQR